MIGRYYKPSQRNKMYYKKERSTHIVSVEEDDRIGSQSPTSHRKYATARLRVFKYQ